MADKRGWFHVTVQYCLLALGAFFLGYLLGRIESLHARLHRLESEGPSQKYNMDKPRSWLVQPEARRENIEIDNRKFVTEVSTAGLEKPADLALGEKKTVQDDIQAAASKLAQLKRS